MAHSLEVKQTQVPIFLPEDLGGMQIGFAIVETQGTHASIRLNTNELLNEMLLDRLVGLSVIVLPADNDSPLGSNGEVKVEGVDFVEDPLPGQEFTINEIGDEITQKDGDEDG